MLIVEYGIFGLIIGSFLNVVILRESEGKPLTGRSACPSCKTVLAWYDLIPVFSWLALCGRCRYCQKPISIQYPLVEGGTALLFALIGGAGLPIVPTLIALVIVALYMCIIVYDLHHTIIPDVWSYCAAAAALGYAFTVAPAQLFMTLVAGPAVALPLAALWVVSRGRWMGLGDAKLALSMGWLLGLEIGIWALLGAFILGAVVSLAILLPYEWWRVRTRGSLMHSSTPKGASALSEGAKGFTMKSEVPFGPFLIASSLFLWFMALYDVALPLPPLLGLL